MPSGRRIAVGAFVFGGLLLFAVGLFLIGDRRKLFSRDFELYTEFIKLNGLQNGSKVRVSGMDAGEVLEIRVPPGPESKFRVKFRVLEKLHPIVRTDSVATIQTDGLLGNKFLQIDAGTGNVAEAPAGGTIPSREPFEWSDLMQEVHESIIMVNRSISDVSGNVQKTIQKIADTTDGVNDIVTGLKDDVKQIAASADSILRDASAIVGGVRAGRGTAGKLFNDDALYHRIAGTVRNLEQATSNVRETTGQVNEITAEFRSRDIIPEVEKAVRNVREVTDQLRRAAANVQGGNGDDAVTDLRRTLANAREAMSDLAEDMEALKRNWFFRGFFKRRGFYDLDDVTPAEYQAGEFAADFKQRRIWLHENQLFARGPDGSLTLTEQGKERLDNAMAELLQLPINGPLMVEGYLSGGDEARQFLGSRSLAGQVRDYLVKKFDLKPNHVGVMPMGATRSRGQANGANGYWEGISLVLFYKK